MLIRNSERKNRGLPPDHVSPRTKDCITGTFLPCGFENTSFTSLTQAQHVEFQEYLAKPVEFMLIGTEMVAPPRRWP